MPETTILDPAGNLTRGVVRPAAGPRDLRGKTVAFIDNAKPNFNHLIDDIAQVLIEQHGVAHVIRHRKRAASIPGSEEVYRDICDRGTALLITGSGD